jgi:type I site-specific restriction-modification system R (restriction) subunit
MRTSINWPGFLIGMWSCRYKQQIGSLFHYNEVLVASDGTNARVGSLTANHEWFKVWRTIDGKSDAPKTALELEVMVRGVFDQGHRPRGYQHREHRK